MRNFKKKIEKNEKGITLVSLVITIIVLLILATVAINIAIDSNGLFARARKVAEDWNTSVGKEETALDEILQYADEVDGIKVEKVTDKEPGKLEEDGNTFTINSIEDLVFFAYDVTNGNNYEGKTVKLGLSLNFNSNKSYVDPYSTDYAKYGYNGKLKTMLTTGEGFIPIGAVTNEVGYENKSFKGTFDGNGKIIKNLYINKEISDNVNDLRLGLFGNNYGKIKKLGIENCSISGKLVSNGNNSAYAGGICGKNCKEIEETFISGNILSYGVGNAKANCGGVCGESSANTKITNCYNLGNINCISESNFIYLGGICGISHGDVTRCYNGGKIVLNGRSNSNNCYIGGICGRMIDCILNNCYNLGDIELNEVETCYVGGITGGGDAIEIENCYNQGKFNKLLPEIAEENWKIGLLFGYCIKDTDGKRCAARNCSSLKIDSYKLFSGFDGEATNVSFSTSDLMPEPVYILGESFTMKDNYPAFKWQS